MGIALYLSQSLLALEIIKIHTPALKTFNAYIFQNCKKVLKHKSILNDNCI